MSTRPLPHATPSFDEQVESTALFAAMIAGVAMALWALLIVRPDNLPLVGAPNSVAAQAVVCGMVVATVVSALAYWRSTTHRDLDRPGERKHDFRWSIVPITVGAVIATGLVVLFGMEFLSDAFVGIVLSRIAFTLILTLTIAVVAYVNYSWISHIHAQGLLYLALFTLFGSLLFSGALNEDPYWWEYSFSHLGMTASNSKMIFNVGLILTGAMLLAWHQYFIERVTTLVTVGMVTAQARRILRIALIVIAVCIALVGTVRFGIGLFFNIIHDLSAAGMGVVLGLVMLSLPWLMPIYQRNFYIATYVTVAFMVLVALLKVLGYVSLTGLEMYEFVLAGLWLALFMRNTDNVVERVLEERATVARPGAGQSAGKAASGAGKRRR
ncbi:MAG: hypothetical protein ACRC1H_10865 [Caldilineaceae bacterium]